MNDSSPAPSRARRSRVTGRRFVLNIGLLLVVVLVFYLWFQFHLEHHVTASRLIGGTLSIWGIFELLHGALDWAAEDEMKSLPQRVLGRRHSTAYLLLALFLGVALHVCTSSVWIEYEPTAGASSTYEVEVLRDGRPFLEPLKVSSAETIAGHTFFFRFKSTPLTFRFIAPRGFQPQSAKLRWGRRTSLTVPGNFEAKSYHLIRLLPMPDVISRLADPGAAVQTPYALEIKCGSSPPIVFRDVRKGVFHLGALEEEMRDVLAREKQTSRQASWNALLPVEAATSNDDLRARDGILTFWESHPVYHPTPEFKVGTRIECRLFRQLDNHTVASSVATLSHEITDAVLTAP